ncbi:MAG: hypothetical protein M9962_07620 [Oligoflexia bacterium]|nr:hypothetical protein [Oligoflexia bacterium]
MKTLFAVLALLGVAATADAGVPVANDMTCAQTLAYSARHGRVYIRTYSGDVIPIYGYNRACDSHDEAVSYWVRTLDNPTCVIGHRCVSRR